MNMIWWLLPAVAGMIGLMFTFAGIGRLFKLKPISGGFRFLFGAGFLSLAAVVTLIGLNLQTYKRLTFERPVAVLTFEATASPEVYGVRLIHPGGDIDNFELKGDEWELNARVVKFKAFSNLLGFDSIYKLDRLYGRFVNISRASETNGVSLAENPGVDIISIAIDNGGQFGVEDARYGSAVYNPMQSGLSYIVCMTQTGLIARPNNQASAAAVGSAFSPNAGCAKEVETLADAVTNADIPDQTNNPLSQTADLVVDGDADRPD